MTAVHLDEGPLELKVTLKFKSRNDFDVYRMMAAAERETDESYATELVYRLMKSHTDGDSWLGDITEHCTWKKGDSV